MGYGIGDSFGSYYSGIGGYGLGGYGGYLGGFGGGINDVIYSGFYWSWFELFI